ncbi:hypothetical protein NLJ89_g1928 [Agrocybe chaxingu]|uniref:GH16 domain-containing protein n=1 Tax=Agrocybe chaxingu TaxID=84603 RepID=A0A9W8TCL7_9AGAR|nr:hypothetical protein NLJ89_g1928 [Agrocybe chaxingu]
MRWSLLLLSVLPVCVLAGKFQESNLRSGHASHARSIRSRGNTGNNTGQSARAFTLTDYYRGQSFLDGWDFFSGEDPTHGNVNYQTKENAIKKRLAYVQDDGTTILAVDNTSTVAVGGRRDSVRISTKKTWTGGLFIADFWSMPHGCSVWPAYWSLGPDWPNAGEIDVLEGVHEQETNSYTLHTSVGCEMSNIDKEASISNQVHPICASSGLDNRGCGFSDTDTRTYGKEFNLLAGGVFAHVWDDTGIKIWRFLRPEIPADITSKKPNPATWGTPAAFFPSTNCDIGAHFFEHSLVLDTTICGDLGNPTYATSGCPGTCAEAVANNANFKFARWQLNYIAVYQ